MLRALRRITLLLLAFVAVMAAALYLLYFRRTPLPPAAPHEHTVPVISAIPGLSACWVETAKTFSSFPFGSTAGSVLVRHPAGDLLIDTGNSSYYDQEISGFPFATWLKLKSLAGQLKPKVPLPDLLRRIGEDPAKLRWAILSHVHLDHAGGLMDLPPLPVLLTREELQFAADPSVQAKGYVIVAHTQKFPPVAAPTLRFEPAPYETFDESADLYRDGSVVVVPLRGHTPGSVGIFVNLSRTRRLFYVGDAVDDEKVPGLAILPAHGRSAYKKFFPGGPLSCISGP